MGKKKRAATMEDPIFEAIAGGHYRFAEISQAVGLLDRIGRTFVIAKTQDPINAGAPPSLRLWIRGFAVTAEEKKQGYRGHFARLAIEAAEGGKFTVQAEKIPVELTNHPQKERPRFKHPNWGHPILRSIQKKKPLADAETARAELLRLHEEFPETTIPGTDKLHLMIYSKQATPPIQKITLKLAAQADGSFLIEAAEQRKKPPAAPKIGASTGKFTSLVSLQRKRKPKNEA